VVLVVAALGASLLASCSSTPVGQGPGTSTTKGVGAANGGATTTAAPTTTAPMRPAGQQGSLAAVPWHDVGPGWLLAEWSPNPGAGVDQTIPDTLPPSKVSVSIFLVDPLGGRYLVTVLPPGAHPTLADWSGDGRRALFVTYNGEIGNGETISEINLTTGKTIQRFAAAANTQGATYTRPNGQAVLTLVATPESPGQAAQNMLVRDDLSGSRQQSYPTSFSQLGAFNGNFAASPDGLQLALGAPSGVAIVGNDGTVEQQVTVPDATWCIPTRWWAPQVVLASCALNQTPPQLWEIPTGGGTPTELTAPPVAPDSGDMNAWQLPSGVYVQAASGCGSVYVAKIQPNGSTSPVTIPQATGGTEVILGAADGRLAIQARVGCGGGQSLLWFDPVFDRSTVVLGPPLMGGGVETALGYPESAGG
jgi:hypothetical protein